MNAREAQLTAIGFLQAAIECPESAGNEDLQRAAKLVEKSLARGVKEQPKAEL